MADQPITCASCGRAFLWTVGEQRFYKERGLSPPRRCPTCREAQRTVKAIPPALHDPAPTAFPIRRRSHWVWASAYWRYGLIISGVTLSLTLLIVLTLRLALGEAWLAWLLALNVVAIPAYVYDKRIAGSTWTRIPRLVLLGIATVGGSPGALVGMLMAGHKTSLIERDGKRLFLKDYWLIVTAQVALGIAWLLWTALR